MDICSENASKVALVIGAIAAIVFVISLIYFLFNRNNLRMVTEERGDSKLTYYVVDEDKNNAVKARMMPYICGGLIVVILVGFYVRYCKTEIKNPFASAEVAGKNPFL